MCCLFFDANNVTNQGVAYISGLAAIVSNYCYFNYPLKMLMMGHDNMLIA